MPGDAPERWVLLLGQQQESEEVFHLSSALFLSLVCVALG